ncbi:hypothetical protein Hypma_004527 [Hypsizygus marmoreus]|uniref:Uncharacterized protein n=1 Tax=Hypsizygus marmoreus TaxID=39966 RepID=A0A369JYG0_HYPMA|nr:hypothetical protein Hypma_004527 [Hypsizygus marmoreus]
MQRPRRPATIRFLPLPLPSSKNLSIHNLSNPRSIRIRHIPQRPNPTPEPRRNEPTSEMHRLIRKLRIAHSCLARREKYEFRGGETRFENLLELEFAIVEEETALEWVEGVLLSVACEMHPSRCFDLFKHGLDSSICVSQLGDVMVLHDH